MPDETEVARKLTALIPEKGRGRLGHLILTTERLVFYEEKFSPNAAFGAIASLITDSLQKRHEEGGPLVVIALADVVEVTNEKKLLNKDRMRIHTRDAEYLFNDGYGELAARIAPQR